MTLFNCTTDQVWVSLIRINFCRSNAPFGTQNTWNTQLYTCIDKFSWNLKFHVGFFNAFLLCFRKVLYKNSPLKCSRRAYYAPFAVLRYIFKKAKKPEQKYLVLMWPWPWCYLYLYRCWACCGASEPWKWNTTRPWPWCYLYRQSVQGRRGNARIHQIYTDEQF